VFVLFCFVFAVFFLVRRGEREREREMESGNGSVDRWEDATTATGSGTGLDDWTEGSFDVGSSDVEILKRVWRNEKAAPDILPYEARLIERVHEQILLMVSHTHFAYANCRAEQSSAVQCSVVRPNSPMMLLSSL
jgi:hypothetical protein